MPSGTSVRTGLIWPYATEPAQDRAGNRWEDWVRCFRRCTFVNNVETLECIWYPVRSTVARWTLVGRCIGAWLARGWWFEGHADAGLAWGGDKGHVRCVASSQ
jgi:hypothetical protein